MTNEELIAALQELPPTAPVHIVVCAAEEHCGDRAVEELRQGEAIAASLEEVCGDEAPAGIPPFVTLRGWWS